MSRQVKSVFITGAQGYIGSLLVEALAADPGGVENIVAADIRLPPPEKRLPGVVYLEADIRSPELGEIIGGQEADVVVHLAAVMNPGPNPDRAFLHAVEVEGTGNLLKACLQAGVGKFIVTSSGAAYGYHPDNSPWLDENDPIRGNREFAYSDHKRQVEEMLSRWRTEHPELKQLIFRPGTILGAGTGNQITALFDRPFVVGVAGSPTPFVFIWDKDVVGAILMGIREDRTGIYNMAGDGAMPLREIAGVLGKPFIPLPAAVLEGILALLARLKLSPYGPEQVMFLRYRPVLANRRLKEEFGYIPQKTSREVFAYFLEARKNVQQTA